MFSLSKVTQTGVNERIYEIIMNTGLFNLGLGQELDWTPAITEADVRPLSYPTLMTGHPKVSGDKEVLESYL